MGQLKLLDVYVESHSLNHSGKSATIRESNHASDVCKVHYAYYYVPKSSIFLTGTDVWKISSVACGFSSNKIDYCDYQKSLISRINEVYVFSIKYHYSDISFKPFLLLQSHLLLCKHGFFDASVMLYNVSVTLSPAIPKKILDVHPWSDSMEFCGIGRGSSNCLQTCMHMLSSGDGGLNYHA